MHIFYEELSYEKIQQLRAFELVSLVSEVGGFLGLLLGASVLTVCELLDYVFLQVCNAAFLTSAFILQTYHVSQRAVLQINYSDSLEIV